MKALDQQLNTALSGRVAWVGLGNPDLGDDGLGIGLARALRARGCADAVLAGTRPEAWLFSPLSEGYDQVVFLDAVDFGGEPGSAVFLESQSMQARFPQVSTHRLSLGILAQWVESKGATRAWLLGVQPASLRRGEGLTPAVSLTLKALADLITDALPEEHTLPVRAREPAQPEEVAR